VLFVACVAAEAEEPDRAMVGGDSELLRFIPKVFASLVQVDVGRRQATLWVEGEAEPSVWPLKPDAEVRVHGWWGRLEQFRPQDRVWVWFDLDHRQQRRGILLLADEVSQQDLHGSPITLEAVDLAKRTLALRSAAGQRWSLPAAPELELSGSEGRYRFALRGDKGQAGEPANVPAAASVEVAAGTPIYGQSNRGQARLVVDGSGLERLRRQQRQWLRQRWQEEGLPGTVSLLHPLSGEMEVLLDHEAIRWGRALRTGEAVALVSGEVVPARVHSVKPWRERTQVRLVLDGFAQARYNLGQRIHLRVPTLPEEADFAEMPPDIGRPRTRPERIDWFLASIYCTCQVPNNTCTGMYYTLSSCSVNACGMPTYVAGVVGRCIDKGMTDQEIWAELRKTLDPLMLKPHLLP
jgi:hypothetical protein